AQETTTDTSAVLSDDRVNAVVIATRHNSHADLVCRALRAGKHVFVEKPLALTHDEIDQVEEAMTEAAGDCDDPPILTVGFNRRAAPHITEMRDRLQPLSGPKCMVMTVNAGAIPPGHWTQDPSIGGGRIIGEGCHFIDLLRFLAASPIESVHGQSIGSAASEPIRDDKATITMTFEDGSLGTVHYFANGHKAYPKERLEVFCDGRVLVMDNYRKLTGYGVRTGFALPSFRQDKGQEAWAAEFVRCVAEGLAAPIPIDELLEVSRATVAVGEALRHPEEAPASS
ncbi:MAG: dehydrogenase, partial [Armatimonadia bacterium]|nr:dehydrogenase [Armatimonadia bacterium]